MNNSKNEIKNTTGENIVNIENSNNSFKKCYYSPDNSQIKMIHIVYTKFLYVYFKGDKYAQNLNKKSYIINGIRVMKKYLIPSLEYQSCKDFTYVLVLGDQANMTYIKSLIDFNTTFKTDIIYLNDFNNYIRNKSKGFDVLITSRMDNDDRIYYDAVNDVRKVVNIEKPMFLFGYNRGVCYFEEFNKYYYCWPKLTTGAWGIFHSLITVLNKVNDSYTLNSLGTHTVIKRNLIKNYKSFGIKNLTYDPAIFDTGEAKWVYVRQKYSRDYKLSLFLRKRWIECDFNLSKFYGK